VITTSQAVAATAVVLIVTAVARGVAPICSRQRQIRAWNSPEAQDLRRRDEAEERRVLATGKARARAEAEQQQKRIRDSATLALEKVTAGQAALEGLHAALSGDLMNPHKHWDNLKAADRILRTVDDAFTYFQGADIPHNFGVEIIGMQFPGGIAGEPIPSEPDPTIFPARIEAHMENPSAEDKRPEQERRLGLYRQWMTWGAGVGRQLKKLGEEAERQRKIAERRLVELR